MSWAPIQAPIMAEKPRVDLARPRQRRSWRYSLVVLPAGQAEPTLTVEPEIVFLQQLDEGT